MPMTKTYEEMRLLLEQNLAPGRYRHSLGVAETAAAMARRFGMNEERARTAGLLHDCGRAYETAALPAEARRRGIPIGRIESVMPLLFMPMLGPISSMRSTAWMMRQLHRQSGGIRSGGPT